MEPIIVRAQATAQDINTAYYLHRSQTELVAPGLFLFIFSVFFAVAFFFVTALRRFDFLGPIGELLHLVCALVSPAIPFLVIYLFQKYERGRDYARGNLLFMEPVVYVINDIGVQFIAAGNSSIVKWENVSRGYDSAELIFFVFSDLIIVLPKRDFADRTQMEAVRKILMEKIPKFSFAKGKRCEISYLNRYADSLQSAPDAIEFKPKSGDESSELLVDPQFLQPDKALVTLQCHCSAKQLQEAHWKFVTLKRTILYATMQTLFWAILICVYLRQAEQTIQEDWQNLTLMVVGLLVCILTHLIISRKGLEKAFDKDDATQVILSESTISIKAADSELNLGWHIMEEIHDTPDSFIILLGKSKYLLMIPKESLNNEFKKLYVENLLKRKAEKLNLKI